MSNGKETLRELSDGLILRKATKEDAEALAGFYARWLGPPDSEEPHEPVAISTRDLMRDNHPTMHNGGFTLVEDTNTGAIVSAICLIPQTWAYGGIEFEVGRPELVATDAEYRRRGLVREQFEVIHDWSDGLGHKLQFITGIPHYYRQFGYDMALEMGGGYEGAMPQSLALKPDEEEPYRVRDAVEKDVPFLAQTYKGMAHRYLITQPRDEALWKYELDGRTPTSDDVRPIRIIETPAGESVGYLTHNLRVWQDTLAAFAYELKPGVSWLAVTPSVMRYLKATGERMAAEQKQGACHKIGFWLESDHPVYDVVRDWLPQRRRPYAYYIRIADLSGFVRHISPVLEQRIAASPLAGHTATLNLNFYRSGLRLMLEQGKLKTAEPWQPESAERGSAAFPGLTFLQLLLGYRSLEELRYAFADCWIDTSAARALLEALFPKQPSHFWTLV